MKMRSWDWDGDDDDDDDQCGSEEKAGFGLGLGQAPDHQKPDQFSLVNSVLASQISHLRPNNNENKDNDIT